MQRRVVITGAGIISTLGDSPGKLHASLCAGRMGLGPIQLFNTDGLKCRLGGEISAFAAKDYVGEKNFRALNRATQLVISAAQMALDDSGWTPEMRRDQEVGLVLGTMFCSVHTISEFDRRALLSGPAYASPLDFANTVLNAAAGQTAILHNLRGVNSTIAAGTASGLQAIAYATELIRSGRAAAILAGGADELCFESFYGFNHAELLCGSNHTPGDFPIPFDSRRNGFALGEGAAFVMLEDAEAARERGAHILAEVKGYGCCNDPSRGADDEKAINAIARAMRLALNDARMTTEEIGCLSASANGSLRQDRHEAMAVAACLNGHGQNVAITAIKSMLGETLGASGAMQAVALLETMRDGVLPGIRQLEHVEKGFPLQNASAHCQEVVALNGMINSIGIDGSCCSVVISRREEINR
jgi:3-oxoacyl-[acyl-carrier-protein] synthase II